MHKAHEQIANAYYTALSKRNVESTEIFLHTDVELVSPLAKIHGKKAILRATEVFTSQFKTLKICTAIGSENQVTVIYDIDCPKPLGKITIKSQLTFLEKLIIRFELY